MAQQSYTLGQSIYLRHASGFYFDKKTAGAVCLAIVDAFAHNSRIRLFYGDAKTGRCWGDEFGIIGTIGRSMGPCTVPLMIPNARSHGGPALLDSCIVGIIDCATRRFTYKHATLDLGQWATVPADLPDYAECATRDGQIVARFKKPGAASRYCQFMLGQRFSK